MNEVIPAWVGQNAKDLIATWGKPTSVSTCTPGSYGGRGAFNLEYHIGDTGSAVEIPEISAYTDSEGITHVYDSSSISIPHSIEANFETDRSGIIIAAHWYGEGSEDFTELSYPEPKATASLKYPLLELIAPTRHGGFWIEPTDEQEAAHQEEVTPDNITEKFN